MAKKTNQKEVQQECVLNNYRLQGLESINSLVCLQPKSHFFTLIENASKRENVKLRGLPLEIPSNLTVSTGTLRNSFYLDVFREYTNISKILLNIVYEGIGTAKFYLSEKNKGVKLLTTIDLTFDKTECHEDLFHLQRIPKHSRVFVDFHAISDLKIYDFFYSTNSNPVNEGNSIFLQRTFGKTIELINSLTNTLAAFNNRPTCYQNFLSQSQFVILDTTGSSEIDSDYRKGIKTINANIHVYKGDNFGGGGNAAQNLYIAEELAEKFGWTVDDYTILDDDIITSEETLFRLFVFNRYKKQNVACGAPIFMESRPTVIWENGGIWGRSDNQKFIDRKDRTTVFPSLINHGNEILQYEHLDELATLNKPDYVTFNLFSFSASKLKTQGYPISFFLRGDDVEYSLRMSESGDLITNPNLSIWQEPAHSYWQEYMAVLHGIVVNAIHGGWEADSSLRFFTECFKSHYCINDIRGLKVYTSILEDLCTDSPLFTDKFPEHYFKRKREFAELDKDFIHTSSERIENLYKNQGENKVFKLNFLHMGVHSPQYGDVIILHQPTTDRYATYSYDDPILSEFVSHYFKLITTLINDHDNLINQVKEKALLTSDKAFWNALYDKNKPRCLLQKEYQYEKTSDTFTEQLDLLKKSGNTFNSFYKEQLKNNNLDLIDKNNKKLNLTTVVLSEKEQKLAIIKQNFDPEVYLKLNPDVKDADMDPWEHFIKDGLDEGRIYRV